MKRRILSLLFTSYVFQCFCQTLITPPSPDASSMVSNFNTSITSFSGVPEISVPITSIKLKSLEVPIYLSYDASGRKVNEIASWVGLGWSLHYGGIITRNVRGIPDDYNQNDPNINDRGFLYANIGELVKNFDHNANPFEKRASLKNFEDNFYDTEPDEFYFNIPGYSGKFYFDANKKIHTIPATNLKIEPSFNAYELKSFSITDERGNKYYFEEIEVTKAKYTYKTFVPFKWIEQIKTRTYNSTWYLSKIMDNTGDKIDYAYNSVSYSYSIPLIEKIKPAYYSIAKSAELGITGKRIATIESNNVSLSFVVNTQPRKDLTGANSLSYIDIYDKTNPKNKIFKKGFRFGYQYFNSPNPAVSSSNVQVNEQILPEELVRLKLHTFTEYSGGARKPPYVFSYNETDVLPERNSKSIDMWGYFNNKQNSTLIPKIYYYPDKLDAYRVIPIKDYTGRMFVLDEDILLVNWCCEWKTCVVCNSNQDFYWQTYNGGQLGGDRSPDIRYINGTLETVMDACNIESIRLPLGGVINYDFEPHEYLYEGAFYRGGGLRIKKVEKLHNGKKEVKHYNYDNYSNTSERLISGRLLDKPAFAYQWFYGTKCEPYVTNRHSTEVFYEFVTERFSQSQAVPGSSTNIGYGRISVTDGSGGKEVYKYNCPLSFEQNRYTSFDHYSPTAIWLVSVDDKVSPCGMKLDMYNTFPFPLNTNYSWNRGQLVSKDVYDNKGNKVSSMDNKYGYYTKDGDSPNIINGITYSQFNLPFTHGYKDWRPQYKYGKYNIVTDIKKVLIESTTKTYSSEYPGDEKYAYVNKTSYTYNKSGLVESVTKVNSDGTENTINYKYSSDFHDQHFICPDPDEPMSDAIERMHRRHILNAPVEVLTYRNGKIVGGELSLYKYDLNNKLVLPSTLLNIQTSKPVNDAVFVKSSIKKSNLGCSKEFLWDKNYYKPVVEFDKYDNRGALLEKHNVNDAHSSIILGYNQNLTIAEATNAKCNEIYFTSFEDEPELITYDAWDPYYSFATPAKNGGYSLKLRNTTNSEKYCFTPMQHVTLDSDKWFHFSVWVYSDGPVAELFFFHKPNTSDDPYDQFSATHVSTDIRRKWTLLKGSVKVPASAKSIYLRLDNNGTKGGSNIWFDDVKFYPRDAQITTYTHDPLVGVTSVTDVNNNTRKYRYDGLGRLITVYNVTDEGSELLNSYRYNYGRNATVLNVNKQELGFEIEGGEESIGVSSSADWNVSVEYDNFANWLSIETTKSIDGGSIKVQCTPTNTKEVRTAKLIVKAGNATKVVTVQQKELVLTADKSTIKLMSDKSEDSLRVISNFDWKASVQYHGEGAESWILLDRYSGNGTQIIKINYEQNNTGKMRIAEILLRGATITVPSFRIEVSQRFEQLYADVEVINIEDDPLPVYFFNITSNITWDMIVTDDNNREIDWLQVTPVSGVNNAQISVIPSINFGEMRAAKIRLIAPNTGQHEVHIVQDECRQIVVDKKFIDFPQFGGEEIVLVKGNKNWQYHVMYEPGSTEEWIYIERTSLPNGDEQLVLHCTPKPDLVDQRDARIELFGPGLISAEIVVMQRKY